MISHRQAEFDRRRLEREERINQIIHTRKQEREIMRKKIFFVKTEEERVRKEREEEEARQREGMSIYFFVYCHELYEKLILLFAPLV